MPKLLKLVDFYGVIQKINGVTFLRRSASARTNTIISGVAITEKVQPANYRN